MHPLTLGKRERLANQPTQTLAQRVVEALYVAGLPVPLVGGPVQAGGHYDLVGVPEVREAALRAVGGRDTGPKAAAGLYGALAYGVAHHLESASADSQPQPDVVGFVGDEGPLLIQLQHVTALCGEEGLSQGRGLAGFFLTILPGSDG